MKKQIVSLTWFLILNSVVFAQLWTVRYNGTGNGEDALKAMVLDNAGNVYVTGSAYGSNNYDYLTIKYNGNGTQQWQAKYNGPAGTGTDQANAIFVDGSGNVYVTGFSYQQPYYVNMDVATVKYNAQGVQQWVARFDGVQKRADVGTLIKADASGNVYVAGWSTDTHASYARKDYVLIKYNSAGVQQWFVTYNGPGNKDDVPYGLGVDGSGNVYVTGSSYTGEYTGKNDIVTIKYNSQGVQLWLVRYNGAGNSYDYASALALDNSGNVYVTGSSYGSTDQDYTTIKYNSSGSQQWLTRYDGPAHGYDIAHALAIDNSGNVYVTGEAQEAQTFKTDYRTVKYNSSGVQQWTSKYNGTTNDNDVANAIAVDGTGNVYVTGYINGIVEKWDIATVKYSVTGAQQWVKRYNGSGNNSDVGNAIAVDLNGNVYTAGTSIGSSSGSDYVLIKYGPSTTGSKTSPEEENQLSPSFSLSQNYPNPFTSFTKIEFTLPAEEAVKLVVYDIRGTEIATLVNEKLKMGSYEVEWNPVSILAGIYFYSLSSGEFHDIRRMILANN